jgi:hypothetical protein
MRKSLDMTTQERDEFKAMLDRIDNGQYVFEGGLPYLNQQDVDIDFEARVGTALQAIDDVEDENAEDDEDKHGGGEGGRMDHDFGTRVGTALQTLDDPHASVDREVAAVSPHEDDSGVVSGALARTRRGPLTHARPADAPRFGSASISLEDDDTDKDSDSQGDRRRNVLGSEPSAVSGVRAADDDDNEPDKIVFDSASLGITFGTSAGTTGRSGAARGDIRFTPSPDADVGANSSGDDDVDDEDRLVAASTTMRPGNPVPSTLTSPPNTTNTAGTSQPL